jgi:hypothetical protein
MCSRLVGQGEKIKKILAAKKVAQSSAAAFFTPPPRRKINRAPPLPRRVLAPLTLRRRVPLTCPSPTPSLVLENDDGFVE